MFPITEEYAFHSSIICVGVHSFANASQTVLDRKARHSAHVIASGIEHTLAHHTADGVSALTRADVTP